MSRVNADGLGGGREKRVCHATTQVVHAAIPPRNAEENAPSAPPRSASVANGVLTLLNSLQAVCFIRNFHFQFRLSKRASLGLAFLSPKTDSIEVSNLGRTSSCYRFVNELVFGSRVT